MIILVCNDDGIRSDGIQALARAVEPVGDVYVVAPDREQSAAGHSLTLHRPLRVEEIAPRQIAIDGTPTDCVNLAVSGILPGRPGLVVSGINKGANLGDDLTYSGTVSAAMEGTLLGIPSVAISLAGRNQFDFGPAAEFAVRLVAKVLEHGLPPDTLLNVNVPDRARSEMTGFRITRQGKRRFGEALVEKTDPRGKKYYWIGGDELGFVHEPGTDYAAILEGAVSITPIHLDLTHYPSFAALERLGLDWP
ncbi:MAG: 5'/3'-nucleotidase SurE [Deltaproteobacteria bacterium]|nr:5'/3'-nucleotidase SurE [Deltaproteobacteria bacterium]